MIHRALLIFPAYYMMCYSMTYAELLAEIK